MTVTVRFAVEADEDELVGLLRAKHSEDGIASFDEVKVRMVLRQGIRREDALIGVLRGRSAIEASIGLFVTGWWYSCDRHLADLWHFVAPSYRQSNHAKELIEFAKRAANRCGYPLLMHQVITPQTTEKAKLFARTLGGQAGGLFLYTPEKPKAA